MLKNLFIRGLWGDVAIPRLSKVRKDIQRAAGVIHQPLPVMGFGFGEENAEVMREDGSLASVRQVGNEPLVDWAKTGNRNTAVEVQRHPGQRSVRSRPQPVVSHHLPFGVSIWRHKLECLRLALREASAVCWLDWDCRLVRELPSDWWEVMSRGKPFQAALTTYKKPKAHWRPGAFGDISRNQVPCGSLVYCRDPGIIDEMIELQTYNRDWYDEQVYAAWVDRANGGWVGPEQYQKLGFSPPDVLVHRAIHVPKNPLFYAPLKIWSYTPPDQS